MAINETKLDYSIADNEVQIAGFDIVRNDRNKCGGGVCIYIRKNLNYKIGQDLMPEQLEIIVVEIKKPNSVPFFISTWCRPPGTPVEYFDSFESVLEMIDSTNGELYVLGDLNCNLLQKSPDCLSRRLLELCELFSVSQVINEPTRVTQHSNVARSLFNDNSRKSICFRSYSKWNK